MATDEQQVLERYPGRLQAAVDELKARGVSLPQLTGAAEKSRAQLYRALKSETATPENTMALRDALVGAGLDVPPPWVAVRGELDWEWIRVGRLLRDLRPGEWLLALTVARNFLGETGPLPKDEDFHPTTQSDESDIEVG